jgi:predicted nucleic acid-binding protein
VIAVLDASAAVASLFASTRSARVAELLGTANAVLAPDLMVSEMTNAIWKYVRAGALDQETASTLADTAIGLVDEYVPVRTLHREALAFSIHTDHPVYDSMYLVLARRNDAVLLTGDKKMRKLAADHGIRLS